MCLSLYYVGLRTDHERTMQQLQQEKEAIEKKLKITQNLLDTQVKKLKQQVRECENINISITAL